MSKLLEKLIVSAIVIAVLTYLISVFFVAIFAIVFPVGAVLVAISGYNILSDGGLMDRSSARQRRRDHRGLIGGIATLAIGCTLLAIGQTELGHIGVTLIVLVSLIGIFVVVLSPSKSSS